MTDTKKDAAATPADSKTWEHSTHEEFYGYYAQESLSPQTVERFRRQRDLILSVPTLRRDSPLDVADIGCGAGTLAMTWAETGQRVRGLDVNGPLIELAKKRAAEASLQVEFFLGSATDVPWESESVDVCFAPELLEHVADWQSCLNEFTRILRPGGALFLSTTNKLCPRQQEFKLPLYSWYPGFLKRHYERLSLTTRPEIANYAKYPAVNWFTYYSLRKALAERGFGAFHDRFDLAALRDNGALKNTVLGLVRALPPLRFLGHVLTEGTTILAIKGKN